MLKFDLEHSSESFTEIILVQSSSFFPYACQKFALVSWPRAKLSFNIDVAVTGGDSYCWHKVPLPNSLSIKMPAYGPMTSQALSFESAEMPQDTDMFCPREKVCHLGL